MKRKFIKKKRASQDLSLQITSMADIFMILLVFLLKSYSSNLTSVLPNNKIKLPIASSEDSFKETLKLEISSDAVLVDQKEIVPLRNFDLDPSISEQDASLHLYATLFEQRKHLPEPNMDSNLLIIADERTPYATVKRVLGTAAKAGFVDLQLLVVQNE